MKFDNKIYTALFISFLLLSSSLYLSIKSINSTSNMIEHIEKVQLKFSNITSELAYSVELNQAEALHSILLSDSNTIKNIQKSFYKLNYLVNTLDKFTKNITFEIGDIHEIKSVIKKRMVSYNLVERSLIKAYESNNKEDIEDALVGLNAITIKFAQDISKLKNIAKSKLSKNISLLKKSNESIKQYILYLFLVAFVVILSVVYKQTQLHTRAKKDLNRALVAEKEQKKLQDKLLKYNDDLESEISKKTKELHQKIYTHFLTGLANRNALLEDANKYNFKQMALLNIDQFQKFNDVYGEEVGNVAIKMSGDFLVSHIDDENTLLYHIGGDEFVIAVKESNKYNNDYFINQITSLLKLFQKEIFVHENQSFSFMVSSGISFSGRNKMLAYADMALKDAKVKNIQIAIFNDDKELERMHTEEIECHKQLIDAFKTDNIISYFQPISPIQDSSLPVKYESLVRLRLDDGTIIPPVKFIDVSKKNRIYYKLTRRVLENTLEAISKYDIPCSMNISLDDIENEYTLSHLYNTLDNYDKNHLLTIELLETEEFKNYQAVYDFCVKIRSYGIKIALDDFGSGYSNFSHILNLPIDYIKIDASLISNIDRDQHSQIMVETIVGLAHKLNIKTIAEFVSSKEILDIVKSLNIDYAQGYYVGKPEKVEHYIPHLLS